MTKDATSSRDRLHASIFWFGTAFVYVLSEFAKLNPKGALAYPWAVLCYLGTLTFWCTVVLIPMVAIIAVIDRFGGDS